jgi:transposase
MVRVVGPDREEVIMSDQNASGQPPRRRRKRVLTAQQKYEVWLGLVTGELSHSQAAQRWGVDRSTIARIRQVAKDGAMAALANSKPGRRANEEDPELLAALREVERLGELVKEQAVELVALRTKSRWG